MSSEEIFDKIEKLAGLRDRGLLNEEEFAEQKSTLLAGLSNTSTPSNEKKELNFQSMSNAITGRLGLDHIEEFSAKSFFSDVFKKHDANDLENIFSVGSAVTTPKINLQMSNLPNPWVFFRVLVGSLIAYAVFYYAWERTENIKIVPGLIIVGSFAVPISTLILYFELNTPRNVSLIRIIQLVVMGGAASILFSLLLYDATPMLGVFGDSAAGIVEEIGKLGIVLLSMRFLPMDRYPYLLNALLFGAAVGTGFAAFESAGYALEIGLSDTDAMLSNITLRGLMSPFAHIAWTSLAAAGYWRARSEVGSFGEVLSSSKFWMIFAFAMALHFIWNAPFEGPFMIKYLVLGFAAWVAIISLISSGLREVGKIAEQRVS